MLVDYVWRRRKRHHLEQLLVSSILWFPRWNQFAVEAGSAENILEIVADNQQQLLVPSVEGFPNDRLCFFLFTKFQVLLHCARS